MHHALVPAGVGKRDALACTAGDGLGSCPGPCRHDCRRLPFASTTAGVLRGRHGTARMLQTPNGSEEHGEVWVFFCFCFFVFFPFGLERTKALFCPVASALGAAGWLHVGGHEGYALRWAVGDASCQPAVWPAGQGSAGCALQAEQKNRCPVPRGGALLPMHRSRHSACNGLPTLLALPCHPPAARVGDTWHHYRKPVPPLPGFKPAKSMVFAGGWRGGLQSGQKAFLGGWGQATPADSPRCTLGCGRARGAPGPPPQTPLLVPTHPHTPTSPPDPPPPRHLPAVGCGL